MRSKFIDEMMHVKEQELNVLNFLFAQGANSRRRRSRVLRPSGIFHHHVEKIQKVGQQRMIHFFQFLLVVDILRIESFDALRFQRLNDRVTGMMSDCEWEKFDGDIKTMIQNLCARLWYVLAFREVAHRKHPRSDLIYWD